LSKNKVFRGVLAQTPFFDKTERIETKATSDTEKMPVDPFCRYSKVELSMKISFVAVTVFKKFSLKLNKSLPRVLLLFGSLILTAAIVPTV